MKTENKEMSIVISKISKEWKGNKVLKSIDLNIEKGEILGLLGPSGAGKTTLIKILTGQVKPNGGKASILGQNAEALNSEMYKQWGLVLDNAGLYERLSCRANLAVFAEIYGLRKECIKEALAKVGLENAEKTPVSKLSKGMRQRLVLARAIMHHPRILFMDEPTSGLDPKTAEQIHGLIQEQKDNGTTVFMTTHNMDEAYKLCDHVALLCDGKIVEYGVPAEVCRRHNYLNTVKVLLKNGEAFELKNNKEAAEKIGACFEQELVESIHSSEPNLETVFMELTGRKLA